MIIRRYTSDDVPILVDIVENHLQETIYKDMKFNGLKLREMLNSNVTNLLVFCNIVIKDEKVVGGILAFVRQPYFSDEVNAYDHFFYVHKDHRTARVVTGLVASYVEWAKARKVRRVFLSNSMGTRIDEFAKLCNRLGFKQLGTIHAMEI